MASIYEDCRPLSFDKVIAQDRVCKRLMALAKSKRGLGGNCYWISGSSGMGETTIARIIAPMLTSDYHIKELSARKLTVGTLEEIKEWQQRDLLDCQAQKPVHDGGARQARTG